MGLSIRRASTADLPDLLRLLAQLELDDRPPPPLPPGEHARVLAEILVTPGHALMVAERDGRVVGTFHLVAMPCVRMRGTRVAQVDAVVVDASARGEGVGRAMMDWAVAESRRLGCFRLQLHSNRTRSRAHRFYERLGFVASHVGMKLAL